MLKSYSLPRTFGLPRAFEPKTFAGLGVIIPPDPDPPIPFALAIVQAGSPVVTSRAPFGLPIGVTVEDQHGNQFDDYPILITAGVASGEGEILTGNSQATADHGGLGPAVSLFTGLIIDGDGTVVLSFAAPGLPGILHAVTLTGDLDVDSSLRRRTWRRRGAR
jgi:hypothetical protein